MMWYVLCALCNVLYHTHTHMYIETCNMYTSLESDMYIIQCTLSVQVHGLVHQAAT